MSVLWVNLFETPERLPPTGSDPVYSNSELPNSYANEAAVTDRLTAVTN